MYENYNKLQTTKSGEQFVSKKSDYPCDKVMERFFNTNQWSFSFL